MKITRHDFFEKAVNNLFSHKGQTGLQYKQAIDKTVEDFNLTKEQARELMNEGEIDIGSQKM